MEAIVQYFSILFITIGRALRFEQDVFARVQTEPRAIAVVIGIAFIGGISLLLGQSIILAVNRVRPARLWITLILSGLLYVINLAIWSVLLWLVAELVLRTSVPLRDMVRLVLLASAPLAFSFLAMMPYLGQPILRILQIWSLLLTFVIVQFQYDIPLWAAASVVTVSGVITDFLSNVIGGPIKTIRNNVQGGYQDKLDEMIDERLGRPKADS